jgi:signal transduction histidine kinase
VTDIARATSWRALREDLVGLADAARRAFSADALVVLISGPAGEPSVGAALGLGEAEQPELCDALAMLLPVVRTAGQLHEPRLAEARLPGSDRLVAAGYASVLCSDLAFDGGSLGGLFALRRSPGMLENPELVATFSTQTAIAVLHRRMRRRTASMAERLENLEALDQVALSTTDFAQLSVALNNCIAPMFDAAMTAVMVWDEQRQTLQMVDGSFGADEQTAASYQISAFDPYSNAARVFSTGRAYLSNDAAQDPGILQDYVDVFGIAQLMSLQLTMADQPIGVLHLANKRSGFTVRDIQRAEQLAPRIGAVVQMSKTMYELRRKQQLEMILSTVAVAIASGRGVQDFLIPALGELCEAMHAGLIALVPVGSEPIVHRTDTVPAELAGEVLEEAAGRPGVRAYVVGPEKVGDPGRAVYCTPVHLGQQRIGTLAALRARAEPFSQDERRALARVANLSALAWASERYQQQRAELARMRERQRIADDLHDDVAQIIFAAQLNLDAILEHDGIDPAFGSEILRARGLLTRGDAAIRTVIHQLSHPVPSDLAGRLTAVVTRVEEDFSMPVHLEISDGAAAAARDLSPAATDALLKVAREALVNSAKHAGPCSVAVRVDVDRAGALRLRIVDDGIGMLATRERNRHGLASLRRSIRLHGGRVRVTRGAAGGTTVTASVPV